MRIASKRFRPGEDSEDSDQMAPVNAVMYYVYGCPQSWLFVSGAEFDREMSEIASRSAGRTITFPKTIRRVPRCAFLGAGIERVVLPKTLKEIGSRAFSDCESLRIIYVEEGCEASLQSAMVPGHTKVGPQPEAMLGNARIWDLRELRDVVIPGGVERIGNYLFWGSDVESVTVPASVREIGELTFCKCKKLKKVTFAEGS